MIKLNNKNITYVALADSNNSIKVPKEIWYADSNNSVKLVYRRKDALIEGEDYEKYHWLKGDGSAYIEGIQYNLWDNHVVLQIGKRQNPRSILSYSGGTDKGRLQIMVNTDTVQSEPYLMVIFRELNSPAVHIADIRPFSSMPDIVDMDFYISNSTFYCEQNGVIKTNNPSQTAIESSWSSITPKIQSSKMSYIREVLPNNTYRSNLIPCKLLKPVPKWLDANGIRRQVGECGMIDLVSGKFYGNVNSVGTFSVENYYERKEWLRAEINVSGRMALLPVNSMNLYFKSKRIIGSNFHYFGTNDYEYYCEPTNVGRRLSIWKFSENTVVYRNTDIDIDSNEVIIDCSPNKIYVNGYEVPIYEYPISHVDIRAMSNTGMETLTSSIFVNGTERYIPCTLTMDLPASMDANNIARTKGTSGMWDLVSDRFYGNVANSGTFKAVNLAEGVDYEVHQWLVGDGTAYINTNKSLVETDIITTKIVLTNFPSATYYLIYGNSAWLYTSTACLQYTNNLEISPISTNVRYGTHYQLNSIITISHSATEILINGASVWQGSSVFATQNAKCHLFATETDTNHCFNGKIGYFNISDNLNLIPCRLLRAIPSTYDANGIARQAGECGMYDTVNDVFYGNVASSGSFTVEDDS